MGTTSEELKKLYKKLGGKDPKVAGFSAPGEILNAINEIPLPTEYELPTVTTEDTGDVLVVNDEGKWDKGEASGGLPEVTTDDNGDILQVVEGAWAKAAMSKEVIVYEATFNNTSGVITVTLSGGKTLRDIKNDFLAGKMVIIHAITTYLYCVNYGNNTVFFSKTNLAIGDGKTVSTMTVTASLANSNLDNNTLSGYLLNFTPTTD